MTTYWSYAHLVYFGSLEVNFQNLAEIPHVTYCCKRLWSLTHILYLPKPFNMLSSHGRYFYKFRLNFSYDILLERLQSLTSFMHLRPSSKLCPHREHFYKFSWDLLMLHNVGKAFDHLFILCSSFTPSPLLFPKLPCCLPLRRLFY